jgi:hypothetical protein
MLVNGVRPTGYTAELTIEGLITGARDRARETLDLRAAVLTSAQGELANHA